MIAFSQQLLLNINFIITTTCILNIFGQHFQKQITINKKAHSIIGSKFLVDNIPIEHFARIPYAKPPINNLRFKPPQEIEGDPWNGVYNSTIPPNTCWQFDGSDFDKSNPAGKLWLSKTTMDEDCLYLSIWNPNTTNTKLPVMVWIYGGSFLSGSSTLEVYDGSILATKHEVVVVSLQYRLGPFGFLYLDDKEAPGNQALLDQNMALKWVKDNIHNFYGDGDRITIFGESAGSASVSLHVLSPLSQNLFNRAIMESATTLAPWSIDTKADSKTMALMFANDVNCTTKFRYKDTIIKCLRTINPKILTNNQFNLKYYFANKRSALLKKRGVKKLFTNASYFIEIYFKPVYDDYFIPKPMNILFEDAISKTNKELLMGFTANEGMYFLLYGLNEWLTFFHKDKVLISPLLSSDQLNYTSVSEFLLENIASIDVAYTDFLPLLLHEYNIPSTILGWKQWNSTQVLTALDQLTGDQNFVCPVVDYAEIMAGKNKKVYLYSFQHRTDKMTFPSWAGAMHGFEIEYVFGMPFSKKFQQLYYTFTDEERKLSEYVMKMWTNFAKYGNPTVQPIEYFNNYVSWPQYNSSNKLTFFLATPQDTILAPIRINEKSQKCKFWNKVIPSITSLLKNVQNKSSINQVLWFNIVIFIHSLWISFEHIL